MFTTKVKGIAQIAFWLSMTVVVIALSHVNVVPLFGVHQKSLSLASVLMPLAGVLVSWVAPFIAGGRSFIAFALTGSYWSFGLYLPGLFGALAWRSKNIVIHCVVPLACMFLFIMHTQGAGAPLYTTYWLIPVALWFVGRNSLLERALASTFVAHAIGSVVWLYAYSIPSHVWHSLIPVVFFERLLFALALVSVYKTAHIIVATLQFYRGRRLLKGWNAH